MHNPWEEIDLKVYENHMSLQSVHQLQALNELMKGQFHTYDVNTAMILGIAGGNGLEHIDKEKFEKVYGVDVNQKYLDECQRRYCELADVFVPVCVDLLSKELQLPKAELLIADLLIEYIGYACFQKVVRLVDPCYVSCVIQINTDDSFVSDSPYLQTFDGLNKVHHQMEENELKGAMQKIGYETGSRAEKELPNGKKLVQIDFMRMKN